MSRRTISAFVERQVAADYEVRRRDGSYFYTVAEIEDRNNVSHWTLHRVCLKYGLTRYATRQRATSRNARLREIQGVTPAAPYVTDALGERVSVAPERVYYRCACGGRSTDPAGHPRCREAA